MVLQVGRDRARAEARSDPLAARAVQEIRRRGSRRFPRAACRRRSTGVPIRHAIEVRQQELSRAGVRRARAKAQRRDRLRRFRRLSGDRRRRPPTSSMRACSAPARTRRRATPPPISTNGRSAPAPGRQAACRTICRSGRGAGIAGRRRSATRPVYVFFISGAKERNPAAAQALIERLEVSDSAPLGRRCEPSRLLDDVLLERHDEAGELLALLRPAL